MRVYAGLVSVLMVLVWASCGLASSVSYSYDAQGRLLEASYDDGAAERYSYDATGNRVGREQAGGASVRILEDGEGAEPGGWRVYDNDPAGAVIARVYDSDRGSRVVEFRGEPDGQRVPAAECGQQQLERCGVSSYRVERALQ